MITASGGSRSRRLPGDDLAAESVQSTSLALESVDDVHGGDGLALGVLGVGDGVTDNVLQEHLENSAGLLVDETTDALHSATASQATDGRLSDALYALLSLKSISDFCDRGDLAEKSKQSRRVSERRG